MIPIRHALVWLGAVLSLAGCSGKTVQTPVVIGHVATKSGPDKDRGEQAVRAIRLAVDEANKDPDKGAGRPVEVLHADARGNPESFESAAVRLVTVNKVAALLGGTSPEEVEHLAQVAVPVVTPCGQRGKVASDPVFFTGLSPSYRGQVLARFAAQKLEASAVAVLADERREEYVALAEAFAREFPAAFARKSPKGKPTLAGPWRFGKDAKFPDLARRVKEEKPRALLFAGKVNDLAELLRDLAEERQAGLPVLFGGDEGSLRELLAERATRGGVYLATAFVGDAGDQAREFVKKYQAAYSEEPDVFAALAYDDARILFEAMRRAKSVGVKVVRDELAGLKDFPSLTGPLSFGEDHRARRRAFVVQLKDGRPETAERYGAED
jgi:branched-chain amino acid transport system substrate-binding protein